MLAPMTGVEDSPEIVEPIADVVETTPVVPNIEAVENLSDYRAMVAQLQEGKLVDAPVEEEAPVVEEEPGMETAQVAAVDPLDATVNALRAANPALDLKTALSLAEAALAKVAPEVITDEVETPAVEDPDKPTTPEGIKAKLKELNRTFRKAIAGMEPGSVTDELDEQIAALEDALPAAEAAAAAKAQQIQAKVQSEYDEHVNALKSSAAKAIEYYPDAGKKGTPLYMRAEQIAADLEAADNPLIYEPNKALKIIQMAANELNIAPKRPASAKPTGTASPPPTIPPTASTARMTAPLTSPGTRPAPDAVPSIIRQIDNVKSITEYEALCRQLALSK